MRAHPSKKVVQSQLTQTSTRAASTRRRTVAKQGVSRGKTDGEACSPLVSTAQNQKRSLVPAKPTDDSNDPDHVPSVTAPSTAVCGTATSDLPKKHPEGGQRAAKAYPREASNLPSSGDGGGAPKEPRASVPSTSSTGGVAVAGSQRGSQSSPMGGANGSPPSFKRGTLLRSRPLVNTGNATNIKRVVSTAGGPTTLPDNGTPPNNRCRTTAGCSDSVPSIPATGPTRPPPSLSSLTTDPVPKHPRDPTVAAAFPEGLGGRTPSLPPITRSSRTSLASCSSPPLVQAVATSQNSTTGTLPEALLTSPRKPLPLAKDVEFSDRSMSGANSGGNIFGVAASRRSSVRLPGQIPTNEGERSHQLLGERVLALPREEGRLPVTSPGVRPKLRGHDSEQQKILPATLGALRGGGCVSPGLSQRLSQLAPNQMEPSSRNRPLDNTEDATTRTADGQGRVSSGGMGGGAVSDVGTARSSPFREGVVPERMKSRGRTSRSAPSSRRSSLLSGTEDTSTVVSSEDEEGSSSDEDDSSEEDGSSDDEEDSSDEDDSSEEDGSSDDEDEEEEGTATGRRHAESSRRKREHTSGRHSRSAGVSLTLTSKVSREGDLNVKVLHITRKTKFRQYVRAIMARFGYERPNDFDMYCIDSSGDRVDISVAADFKELTSHFWDRQRESSLGQPLSSEKGKYGQPPRLSATTAPHKVVSRSLPPIDGRSSDQVIRLYVRDSYSFRQRLRPPSDSVGFSPTVDTINSTDVRDGAFDSTTNLSFHFSETQRSNMQLCTWSFKENELVQWSRMSILGKGSFGTVYEGITADGKILAVKVQELPLNNDSEEAKAMQVEINLMRLLKHRHIVAYYGCQLREFENSRQMEIFLELCHGGSLTHLRSKFNKAKEPFTMSLVRSYTKQILEGLHYLHSQNVMHRDIKGDNVLISAMGEAKLADFGCSKRIGTTTVTNQHANGEGYQTMVGSPFFMAPEVMQGEGGYTKAADVWSVGCLVLELLGREPWVMTATNVFQVMFQIAHSTGMPTGVPKNCPPVLMDFFRSVFERDVAKRATAAQLLKHPWISCPDSLLEIVPPD